MVEKSTCRLMPLPSSSTKRNASFRLFLKPINGFWKVGWVWKCALEKTIGRTKLIKVCLFSQTFDCIIYLRSARNGIFSLGSIKWKKVAFGKNDDRFWPRILDRWEKNIILSSKRSSALKIPNSKGGARKDFPVNIFSAFGFLMVNIHFQRGRISTVTSLLFRSKQIQGDTKINAQKYEFIYNFL